MSFMQSMPDNADKEVDTSALVVKPESACMVMWAAALHFVNLYHWCCVEQKL